MGPVTSASSGSRLLARFPKGILIRSTCSLPDADASGFRLVSTEPYLLTPNFFASQRSSVPSYPIIARGASHHGVTLERPMQGV